MRSAWVVTGAGVTSVGWQQNSMHASQVQNPACLNEQQLGAAAVLGCSHNDRIHRQAGPRPLVGMPSLCHAAACGAGAAHSRLQEQEAAGEQRRCRWSAAGGGGDAAAADPPCVAPPPDHPL